MAGSGRRVFQPGEVLTASNVMNYLQDQAVQVYAGTAARGSAIGTAVSEGMVSYLKDTDLVEVHNGTSWKQISATTGNVLQVVYGSTTTEVSTTSSTYIDTGLTATITPKSASSKIMVLVSHSQLFKNAGNGDASINLQLFRNGNLIQHFNNLNLWTGSSSQVTASTGTQYLDSPASTSALIYKTMFANYANTTGVSIQFRGMPSTIVLMEIAG